MSAADLLSGMMAVDDEFGCTWLRGEEAWMKMKEPEKERIRSG